MIILTERNRISIEFVKFFSFRLEYYSSIALSMTRGATLIAQVGVKGVPYVWDKFPRLRTNTCYINAPVFHFLYDCLSIVLHTFKCISSLVSLF